MIIETWLIVTIFSFLAVLFYTLRKSARFRNEKVAWIVLVRVTVSVVYVICLIMNYQWRYLRTLPVLFLVIGTYLAVNYVLYRIEQKYISEGKQSD